MFVALKIIVSVISKYLSMSTREQMESLSVEFTLHTGWNSLRHPSEIIMRYDSDNTGPQNII